MRRIAFLLALIVVACAVCAPAAGAKILKGPSGLAFYKPPKHLPAGTHGDAIWARKLTGTPALKPSGGNELVLYRSLDQNNKLAAVSGTVTVPKGKPPKGGWPVLTWAHGTTGIADPCAPSRDSNSNPAHLYINYIYPFLDQWIAAGYAVVRTDYQGLGGTGVHEFLVGKPEGRSVLDMVRAARQVDPRIGKRVIVGGHSQGGHAALWAGALASKWTPELRMRGVEAFAPASHIEDQAKLLSALTSPSSLSAFAALIFRALDVAYPNVRPASVLSARAASLYPQTLTKCDPQLGSSSSFGGMAPADLIRQGANLKPVYNALSQNDPENLKITLPIFLAQGTADATVFKAFTDQLDQELGARGSNIDYQVYEGVTHGGIVNSALSDGLAFAKSHLK